MALPSALSNQPEPSADSPDFAAFFAQSEPMLRRAFVAQFGVDLGREAASEALSYGWSNWSRVGVMANRRGYLFRVGQRWARRQRNRSRRPALGRYEPPQLESSFEPGLGAALDKLSPQQRVSVALVVGFGYSHQQVADMLGLSRSSVQTHTERAMASLKKTLGVIKSKEPRT